MMSANQNFVNVSGIDSNDGATIVFVWCRDKGPGDFALLGSGHVVGHHPSPPGIRAGQFSVTFLLPPGCSVEDVFVTDDKSGNQHLTGVTVTPCAGALPQTDKPRTSQEDQPDQPQVGNSFFNPTAH